MSNRLPTSGSLWAATAPPPPATTPLEGEARAEVAIVGAGYTGLSAALHLAEAGIRTTLLETAEIGFGASGRNNGQVIPTLSRIDPDDIVAAIPAALGGADKGESLLALIRDSASLVFDLIQRHGIACEAVQNGWIQPAHLPSRLALSERRAAQWARRGAPVRLLDRAEMEALTGTGHWHGGWENRSGGHLNPLAFARGLAAAAIAAGARIHTQSPVASIERGPTGGWRLATPSGTLDAARVILATQAYTDDLWCGLKRSIIPVRSYQLATAPLPPDIRRTILPHDHALSDTRGDLHFFRFDRAGRLVTGGNLILPWVWRARLAARIADRVRHVFPQLPDPRFEHAWWGYFATTPDRLPHVYELAPGVLTWLGCNGRGLALSVALGRELARAFSGTPLQELAAPVESTPAGIPAWEFRAVGVGLAVASHRWADRRG